MNIKMMMVCYLDMDDDGVLPGHQEQDVQLTNLGEAAPTQPCALQCAICAITLFILVFKRLKSEKAHNIEVLVV